MIFEKIGIRTFSLGEYLRSQINIIVLILMGDVGFLAVDDVDAGGKWTGGDEVAVQVVDFLHFVSVCGDFVDSGRV